MARSPSVTHACHAPNCTKMLPREVFMCARHWRMIPAQLRADLRDAWRTASIARYRHVTAEAIRVVTAQDAGRAMPGIEPGMKALTVWQPWATLIVIGAKPYEFRRWNFADRPHLAALIGKRIVIHAGARKPRLSEIDDVITRVDEGESALILDVALPVLTAMRAELTEKKFSWPLAAAVGTATLGDPRRATDLFADRVADSDRLDQHMYAWPVLDVQAFDEPVRSAGAQGFWNWS